MVPDNVTDTIVRSGAGNLWHEGRPTRSYGAPLAGDASVDVAIIGAGFTGLSTAFHLKRSDASLRVAVLEAGGVGNGASGRNGGFVMTLFGSSVPLMRMIHGEARLRDAHAYMERSIHALEDTIATHAIDCDYRRSGLLRVATSRTYEKRIRGEMEYLESIGIGGCQWLGRDEVQARVASPSLVGGVWEPGCGNLHPIKWVDALARLATEAGAAIYEHSPVTAMERTGNGYRITTPGGEVRAAKVVYATNGYTHLLPGMSRTQLPAFAYIVATEPLKPDQLASIGWSGREAIEDGRNFMHFYRLTRDGRLIVGGGPGLVPFGRSMAHDTSAKAFAHLERFIATTFPSLSGIAVTHRWGGAFSMTADFTPHIRTLDGGRAFASFGCTGHGVAMSQMNGRILSDLVQEKKTDLTDLWFVNRRGMPVPPEPLRWISTKSAMSAMAIDDWWCDRR